MENLRAPIQEETDDDRAASLNLSCQKAHYFFCRLKDDTDGKQLQIDDRAIGGSVQHDGTPARQNPLDIAGATYLDAGFALGPSLLYAQRKSMEVVCPSRSSTPIIGNSIR
jgi:hypothetical protein